MKSFETFRSIVILFTLMVFTNLAYSKEWLKSPLLIIHVDSILIVTDTTVFFKLMDNQITKWKKDNGYCNSTYGAVKEEFERQVKSSKNKDSIFIKTIQNTDKIYIYFKRHDDTTEYDSSTYWFRNEMCQLIRDGEAKLYYNYNRVRIDKIKTKRVTQGTRNLSSGSFIIQRQFIDSKTGKVILVQCIGGKII